MHLINDIMEWMSATLAPLGAWGLFILAFTESSFNPIFVELLLFPLCLANPELSLWFALVATVGSVLGGAFGYGIGLFGKAAILDRFFSKKKIEKVHKMYDEHGSLSVFLGAFTPLPYKIFTISAGVFYISFPRFIVASIFGRGIRFFLEAFLIMMYGHTIIDFIDAYFNWISVAVGVLLVLSYVVWYNYFGGKQKKRGFFFGLFKKV